MTAAAPAPDRPEGGWRDGDAVAAITGVSERLVTWQRGGGQWRRPEVPDTVPTSDDDVAAWLDQGVVVYVHAPREPEPVMEPLPTDPCAIRATVWGVEGVVLVGPDIWGAWWDPDGRVAYSDDITAWEPLLSRAKWEAEQDGDTVRVCEQSSTGEHRPARCMVGRRIYRKCVACGVFLDAERGDQA